MQCKNIDISIIHSLSEQLNNHPLYATVQTIDDLRLFMAHHVYSVWDFMSLLKYLQHQIAPTSVPWTARGSSSVRFFINQIVLGEESDEALPDANGNPSYASHFELYLDAMREIGGNPYAASRFSAIAAQQGIDAALALNIVPPAARVFMESTFAFIKEGKSHVVAAAFAFGREHIIPTMFRSLLDKMGITAKEAPIFHYYLERHIHLDETSHAPLSLRMVNELIGGDQLKFVEAEAAARRAIESRLNFWDGVRMALINRMG
ncbi:DUF3050 domain-containing protein [Gammaproteobacteria bacterium]